MTRLISAVLLSFGLAPPAAAQHITEIEEITDRVTVLMPNERSGNTIILHGPDGALLVDTMADTLAAEFVRTIDGLGVGPVRYVFNTHWHQNHLGANGDMAETATIIGSANLRTRLQSPQRLEFLVQNTYPALPPEYQPTVTFTDSISVHFNGEEVKAWHVQGHTDTDVIVYLTGSGVVATGDLWSQFGPFMTDLDTGGSLWGVASALQGLLDRIPDDVIIVPGHTPPTTVAELRSYQAGLVATLQHVQRGKEAGLSASEIYARPLPAGVQQFLRNSGARFIEAAYRSPRTDAPSETSSEVPPDFLLGEFQDDYENRLTITPETWTQYPGMVFHVVIWNPESQFMVARNDPANTADVEIRESLGIPPDADLWTRIDWVALPDNEPFEWGFCISEYRAQSLEAATAADIADPLTPRTGCNGFPYSRMQRVVPGS